MATLDLAGIITRICTDLKTRFSKVTFTQGLASGTQVGTINVDGTNTTLYAPTPPTASTTTPSMDGTASYGSGTSYARSNHVHPTDTSRQAALVSGTNIKTINNQSILGSGNLEVGGGGSAYDLVINVILNATGSAVASHDASYSACAGFVQAVLSGQDVSAVARCRTINYDDEDGYYNSNIMVLPFVRASSSSYGAGQYEIDGGWSLDFLAVTSVTSGVALQSGRQMFNARRLSFSAVNDDPDLPMTVTYTIY